MQIIIFKTTTQGTFRKSVSLKIAWFFHKLYNKLFHSLETFYPYFFFKSGFKNLCFQLPQIVPWTNEMTRVISASTGLNRVSLAQVLPR